MTSKGEILLYKNPNGETELEVKLEQETVWLTQRQMSEVFDKEIPTINEHIKNVFKDGELGESSTIRKFRIVQQEGKRQVQREIDHYNLDMIISVGYRVNSKRGTQFRIWANKILKDYLVKGYALNEKRLNTELSHYRELKNAIKLLENTIHQKKLTAGEASGLLQVITDYSYALDILDQYDHQTLTIDHTQKATQTQITYEDAKKAIAELQKKTGGGELFGREKDDSFKSSLTNIYQTFDGQELYPSIDEKAANLLYFIVKNHSFSDGNKRIAAFIFIWFLSKNQYLYHTDGTKRIADNALVALTLMIAQSNPNEKEMIIKVIINLINKQN